MNPLASAYLDLQEVDQRLKNLEDELQKDTEHIKDEKSNYKKLDKSLNNTKEVLKRSKAELDMRKLDLETVKDKQVKAAEKLENITNKKEYAALERESRTYTEEMSSLERFVDASEENILKLEDDLNNGLEELSGLKKKIKDMILGHEESNKEFKTKKAEINAEHEKQAQVVRGIEEDLPNDSHFLDLYNKLIKRPSCDALAELYDGVCQGCFMRVNAQIACLVQGQDKLGTCTSCQRILYSQ